MYSGSQGPPVSALILRSGALSLILYQIRLLVKDLADTPVFLAALAAALFAAYALFYRKVKPLEAVLILILVPPVSRFFIAFPRFFFTDTSVVLDSLLLNLDRNAFVSLFPFYWAGISTYFACRSRGFLRADIIMADGILITIFTLAPAAGVYRWPVLMILMVVGVLFPQILALILSAPFELAARKREQFGAAAALFALVIAGGFLFLGPFQEKAAARQGGLLAPNLFTFDLSPFIHLESEISVNDDLVFIVKKDPSDNHILLRRGVLSGYAKKRGFFRREPLDEKTHPQRRPETRSALEDGESGRASRLTEQEYYLVNVDSRAFIAMNKPVLVTPFENWDASSFSAAYAVRSQVNEALIFELFDSAPEDPGPADLGLSPEEYAVYTDYGDDERIAALARVITQGAEYYQEKVEMIYQYLKEGEYRYSLKPGIAADGDQLRHFLFTSKKGYCSYYAFAMTLLLRSLDIPARVAAGFFIDSSRFSPRRTDTSHYFNYYPISANMAHTWVEVCYPGYGWVEYDPTTELLAKGEEFQFASGMPAEFERLMKEILDNHGALVPKDEPAKGTREGGPDNLRNVAALFLFPLLAAAFVLPHARYVLASGLSRNPRKKANLLWARAKWRLALGGYKPEPGQTESEWVKASPVAGADFVYQKVAVARYAPEYTMDDFAALAQAYRDFSRVYQKGGNAPPLGRRLLMWVFPPAALALGPPKKRRGMPSLGKAGIPLFLLCAALSGDAQDAGEEPDADSTYAKAQEAQGAEYWEQAIALYARGLDRYPDDYRFSWALGNLYYARKLYDLAWDQYRRTEVLLPEDTDVLYQLSRTAARLNRNTLSAQYLERILALEPDNTDAIGGLGWMYSKLHRLGEGKTLLLSALERLGPNPDFAMILGTIFSNLFEYDEAKKWYLDAIASGEKLELREFTAVSHYNLSILESRFYHYDRAFERTNASLRTQNRASGRIARGELFLRRLDFRQAFSDYHTAYEIDPSPLSKINLAQSYRRAGNLEEARAYAEDCLRGGDLSWMLNFGIDPIRYKRDIHEILYQAYAGLARVYEPGENWRDRVRGLFRRLGYRYKREAHLRLFRKYSLLSANVFKTDRSAGGESNLDALMQYYHAFEAYPRRALTYLRKAKTFEAPRIPESASSYDYEEARLLRDMAEIAAIIPRFDPVWERDMIADAYAQLAKFRHGGDADGAAEQLYALNKGALGQQGIKLPVLLTVEPGARRLGPALVRELKAAGFEPRTGGTDRALRFRLRVDQQGGFELFDGEKKLLDHTLDNRRSITPFIQELRHLFFPPPSPAQI